MAADTKENIGTDTEIIKQVLSGNRDEFRHLVLKYQNSIFSLVCRQVGDRSIAEELAQEIFVRAYTNLSKFRFEAAFATWLTRIALNHTNSYLSSKRHRQRLKSESFDQGNHDRGSEVSMEQRDTENKIGEFRKALARLTPKLRDTITLCGLEGKSYEDAAQVLGIPIGTVRSRLNKARLILKVALSANLVGGVNDD